ncbi:MAG: iron chelate uptake ABC transporter family permease subunit [Desulfobacteraceae bacterium]|nr:iron chelate uptake ABC transporter family permease subunit [Desulfobacteraceae bacterium]
MNWPWLAGAVLLSAVFLKSHAWANGLTDQGFQWAVLSDLLRVFSLQDYNTRVVIIGTGLLGLAAGLAGTFLLLRKRALLSDTLSHATLPGIALAFMLMSYILGEGKHLIGLIIGAAFFSIIATVAVLVIERYSRLKDDAALGIVLSVFFGLGIAIMGLATRMASGNSAGLMSFIYGKTASMLFLDSLLIAVTALVAALFCMLFFKEFTLVCFDSAYAFTQGWPVARLDFFMMTLVVVVTVVGLQAVGLILVVALLIIPAAAARFWTHRLSAMLWLSGLFGTLSGMIGAGISALMANLPAGAVIVLTASALFLLSLAFGTQRGLLRLVVERLQLRTKIIRENLLRELYEWLETSGIQGLDLLRTSCPGPRFKDLLARRSWRPGQLKRALGRLCKTGLLNQTPSGEYQFTQTGLVQATHAVRKHRLWEAYLISHADIAAGQVDWAADEIEHILDQEMISKLEALLPEAKADKQLHSPHELIPAKTLNSVHPEIEDFAER